MTRRKQGQRVLWEGMIDEDVRSLWEPWMLEADRLLGQYALLLGMIDDNVRQLPEEKRRRSRPLRKLEIELRRMIEDLQGARRNAPWDAQELFDSPLQQSESVRTTLLQLIFGKGLLKGE